MTAVPASDPPGGRPFDGAPPAQIRAALTAADAVEFDRQWRAAMDHARDQLDLTGVSELLESWRRVAWMTTVRGPQAYERTMADAERRLRTGERAAGAVSWRQLSARLGLGE